jgi:hypothetical protein
MHSPSSSFSLSACVQYIFFAAVVYVLAGAPLNSVFSNGDTDSYSGPLNTSADQLRDIVIPTKNLSCPDHAYKGVHVLSREPLVVYIEGFLSEMERGDVLAMRYQSPPPPYNYTHFTSMLTPHQRAKLRPLNDLLRRPRNAGPSHPALRKITPPTLLHHNAMHRRPRTPLPGLAPLCLRRKTLGAAISHGRALHIPLRLVDRDAQVRARVELHGVRRCELHGRGDAFSTFTEATRGGVV